MSSSVRRSWPLQLALDVRFRNLWNRSLLLANTSSMLSGAGAPKIWNGSLASCSTSARRSSGESAHAAITSLLPPAPLPPPLSSSSESSSSSVLISGSSIDSPFWKRGDDRVADFAADLAPAMPPGPCGRAGVL